MQVYGKIMVPAFITAEHFYASVHSLQKIKDISKSNKQLQNSGFEEQKQLYYKGTA